VVVIIELVAVVFLLGILLGVAVTRGHKHTH
jgi:hypothetical protein